MEKANKIDNLINNTVKWVDVRFPLTKTVREQMTEYYAAKNLNWWYITGSMALALIGILFVTGILLAMHYIPSDKDAFLSLEYIRREVPFGYIIQYMHSVGASLLFIIIYLHIFRAMLYGSYRGKRDFLWIGGIALFFTLMGESFFGYLLPWGQLSYWGAQVITSMFETVPFIGDTIAQLNRGDYAVSDATLNRFYSLHVVAMPLAILGLIAFHLVSLHEVGSTNPDGIEIHDNEDERGVPKDGIPFFPYHVIKDAWGICILFTIYFAIVFFAPEFFGIFMESPNFTPANPASGPEHVFPLWYFAPYFSVLRAMPGILFDMDVRLLGVSLMGLSQILFALLPWLDKRPVSSIRYSGPIFKIALLIFALNFIFMTYLGVNPTNMWGNLGENGVEVAVLAARIGTFIYFAFFLLMPFYTRIDKCKPVPERVV